MSITSIPVDAVTVDDLYARWEEGNWSASAIDFVKDRRDWSECSMFLHGEDAVAENLSPFIDAAPREEHKYFLATQQVDEARHSVFFARFTREVVDIGTDAASSLAATQIYLSWGFRQVFEFVDAEPWHLRVADGTAEAAPGRVGRADVLVRCELADWVDVAAGRARIAEYVLRRRIRMRGRPSALVNLRRLFA
jgi:hypothetical protein